ncbi:MAG: hypothetical protein RL722_1087 [Pseudomonadota bacterium]|jgi:hypothetical protein
MRPTLVIWGSALAERRRAGSLRSLVAVAALLLLGTPIALVSIFFWSQGDLDVAAAASIVGVVLSGGCFLLVMAAWMGLLLNVLQQNHPGHARLVPGHRRRLRSALLHGLAVAVGLAGLVPGLCWVGVSWVAPAKSIDPMALPLALTGMAMFLAWLGPSMRWPQINLLWFAVPVLLAQLTPPLAVGGAALFQGYRQGGGALWWATTLAVAALSAGVLRTVVLGGGVHHRRIHARVPRMSQGLATQLSAETAWAQWGLSNVRLLDGLGGRWWLRRRLQARLTGARAQPSLGLALPPDLQVHGQLAARLPALLLLVLAAWLLGLSSEALPWFQGLRPAVLGGCVGSSLAAVQFARLRQAVQSSRGEQALLGLMPGTPRGAGLNRWLAWRLTRAGLALVAVHGVAALGAMALLGAAHGGWWTASLSALLLSLCAIPALWQDWSRTEPASRQAPVTTGLQLWLLLVAMALNLAAQFLQPDALPWLWGLQALAAVAWARWCWSRLGQWPSAWPVGHARAGRADAVAST